MLLRDVIGEFMAVAQEGSFSAAARKLYTTQPNISAHMAKLEQELDVQLFVRKSNGVSLTPAGRCFLEGMNEATECCERAVMRAKNIAEQEGRRLAIGVLSLSDSLYYERIIDKFKKKYPEVELSFVSVGVSARNQVDAVETGDVDFVRMEHRACTDERQVTFTNLTLDENCLLVALDHKFGTRDAVSVSELNGEKIVILDNGSDSNASVVRRQIALSSPSACIVTAPLDEGLMSSVQEGSCMLLTTSSYAWDAYTRMHSVRLLDTPPVRFGIVHRPILTPAQSYFLELAIEDAAKRGQRVPPVPHIP